ncbi:MAG: hypothetical protein DRH26_00560 [Deltaproteobacteria bacterium]|nr:MAG: hypothetical protein DRH26_00560 [Deltaproteobacteria bacterium]
MTDPVENPVDPAVLADAADALKIAKITLMMQKNTVFYTTILFSLKQTITDALSTAATDGKSLLINPVFFNNLTPNERLTLLAHEVLHVAFDHMHRIGERDPQLWNYAADYVINYVLVEAGYTLPKGGLHDIKYGNKTTEAVYDLLNNKTETEKIQLFASGGKNNPMNGNDITYPKEGAKDQVTKDEVTEIVLRATTQAKAMGQAPGSVPGEIAIELEKTLNPPLPWYVILNNYLTDISKDDYSFRRPNRRFLPKHYLPTAHSEAIPNIAIAVDASGSVSPEEFNTFISKIAEIQEVMQPKKITVIGFDTKIKNVQELEGQENPFTKLKFTGRGGTNITPIHDWVDKNKPTLLLVFTDGKFQERDPVDPSIPIIWLIHDNPTWASKCGRVITYDINI